MQKVWINKEDVFADEGEDKDEKGTLHASGGKRETILHTDAMLRNLSKGLRKELEKTSALIPVLLEIVALYATKWLRPCRAQNYRLVAPVARGEDACHRNQGSKKKIIELPWGDGEDTLTTTTEPLVWQAGTKGGHPNHFRGLLLQARVLRPGK